MMRVNRSCCVALFVFYKLQDCPIETIVSCSHEPRTSTPRPRILKMSPSPDLLSLFFCKMSSLGFGSLAVHAGQDPDPVTGAVIPPISLSTTFAQSAAGVHKGFEYSRSGNPTRAAFEIALAALEGGNYGIELLNFMSNSGLAFASGSVTTATVASLLPHGSHLVSVNDVYGGTYRYFTKVASTHGIESSFIDLKNPQDLKKAIKANTRMVWIETPSKSL